MPAFVLAIDQGTTSTRSAVFDEAGVCRGWSARELTQHYPRPGWVEHDADEVWRSVAETVPAALAAAGVAAADLAAVGITNQRETVVLWDRDTGAPVHRAVVWQDRRTADFCRERAADEPWLRAKTGLLLDPYFSATKLRWLLADPAVRARAEAGHLAAGTVDTFLLWRLTAGRSHLTDTTNASRTLLLDIRTAAWDADLCRFFGVPEALLPGVRPSAADFGVTAGLDFLPDGLPVRGVAGDQQAALFGQAGFDAGAAKCTYGTGAFFLQHTGTVPAESRHRLLTSLAAMPDGTRRYVLEGSVFVAGAAVQWLRDGLRLFARAEDVEPLAAGSDPEQPVIFVPGFVGLGAPHWVPGACGVVFGLTRSTTGADLARAALEGVAHSVADLIEAAGEDTGAAVPELRADGGMARNDWFLQCQADALGRPVVRAAQGEATALGAAYLAGLGAGVWPSTDALARLAAPGRPFAPRLADDDRRRRSARWRRAVRTVVGFYTDEADHR